MEGKESQALGSSSGSCLQDNCMFVSLLESQTSSSSGTDRHVPINPTISHSASWSTDTETDPHITCPFTLSVNEAVSRSRARQVLMMWPLCSAAQW
ncbi:hypothetical protein Q5P01_012586 [Channa striata]|uniref:Uncharacterized protein n=1 Tax=Channa striata TaxID=64152 RepID=A0AA88MS68_CHASR|nr:hypothetical protein Q5P01_012586 [Channa striata]